MSCVLAALCYAEFAAMAPVAGSAYTYAYTTLGEIFAWMIGWDLILEYAMACATVASAWSNYLNKFLLAISNDYLQIPKQLLFDPFTSVEGLAGHPWLSLPSVCITLVIMAILILGIRESARTNAVLVGIKVSVVLLVIGVGCAYIQPANWTSIPYAERSLPEEFAMHDLAREHLLKQNPGDEPSAEQVDGLTKQLKAEYRIGWIKQETERLEKGGRISKDEAQSMVDKTLAKAEANLPRTEEERQAVDELLPIVREKAQANITKSWGILAFLGIDRWLQPIDDSLRGPFMPYGLSGIMLGAAIVFFAYIGFDSISTHAEEAKNPARDMPIAILTSLAVCTVLYVAVTAVITGMVPYPNIDIHAPIAAAFADKAAEEKSTLLKIATSLIAAGGLAGMTSVLLVMLQSQARIFMAMSRDGLLPKVFSVVHPRFRTPHLSTLITGTGDLPGGRIYAHPEARGNGQHRHADGVCHRVCGGAVVAIPASRRQAAVPLPDDHDRGAAGRVGELRDDAVPAGGYLGAAGDLAADRAVDLLPLQPPAQPLDQQPGARNPTPRRGG